MSGPDSQDRSYRSHVDHLRNYSSGAVLEARAKTWLRTDTVDAWRHNRMYSLIDPLLVADPCGRWLTVGDGRYGKDAMYILQKGLQAHATDISDVLLEEVAGKGLINSYSAENAEHLSFGDDEFDYVLCKEAYHHFPRPMVALYEMLRVVRMAVVLLEPNDPFISRRGYQGVSNKMKNLARRVLLGYWSGRHQYEDSGNYVYTLSRREVEKVALGLNFKLVAFKGFNDAFFEGVEREELSAKGPLQQKVKAIINVTDALCRFGLSDYKNLSAIIFKIMPGEGVRAALRTAGYELHYLPENPYLI